MKIMKDSFVIIEYSVHLEDGSCVKGGDMPASMNFVVGYDQVLPALERRLMGLEKGVEVQFVIPAREAFGFHQPNEVRMKTYEEFPQGRDLEKGKWVMATNPDTSAQYSCLVVDKTEEGVVLDFNHPLAGKDLHYSVKIVHVRPALPEELEYLRPCEHGQQPGMQQAN